MQCVVNRFIWFAWENQCFPVSDGKKFMYFLVHCISRTNALCTLSVSGCDNCQWSTILYVDACVFVPFDVFRAC